LVVLDVLPSLVLEGGKLVRRRGSPEDEPAFAAAVIDVGDGPSLPASSLDETTRIDAHSSASLLLSAKLKISFSVVQVHELSGDLPN